MPRAYLVNVEAGQNDTRKKTIKINNDNHVNANRFM